MFLTYDTVEAFAVKRNPSLSFPFLKENGELLSICVNSGFLIEPRALDLYKDFYRNAFALTQQYPQYYRFILGMVLDLETGGMKGTEGERLTEFITKRNLVMFDTSDVRKLETLTMLQQRGRLSTVYERLYKDIVKRLEDFVQNPAWYMKFNKPLFYDLTHVIFYLTNYGAKATSLRSDLYPCLMHMGTLALLDSDADLLSEVCLCLKYIGRDVPPYWNDYLSTYLNEITISFDGTVASALNPCVDEYHIYLVLNAYLASQQNLIFQTKFNSQKPSFSLSETGPSVLEKLAHFSHQEYFRDKKKSASLDKFILTLPETEFNHWQSVLASSAQGKPLVHEFSGLS